MIHLSRLDGTPIVVNADHISTIEHTPDTMLTLTNHSKILVQESVEVVIDRVVAFRRLIGTGPTLPPRQE
ncbi:MAG TPA: flagellar FlbD family protein [Vulgatibacter sp.]|nr:flagellar FlbD family protein [Vulgatibacter sp.]